MAQTKAAKAKKQETDAQVVVAYKGFDRNLQCRGFQYEIGKEFVHDGEVKACEGGFHACEHPLNVFGYYAPSESRFCVVELSGELSRHGDDTKIAAGRIRIKAEIGIPQLVADAVRWVMDRCTPENTAHATGYRGAASATGTQGAASATGNWGAASATGYQGAASATGDQGAASATGDQGAASATGYRGAASATGYRGAASATGYRGAASATGTQGAASATGTQGAAMSAGYDGRVMGADGNALFLVERNDDYEIVAVWAGIAGRDGIKPDTWYALRNGKPVEVE